jgi:ABC-type multidrug transport system fused ATPase/permease subunit
MLKKSAGKNSNPIRDMPKYLEAFRNHLGLRVYSMFFLTMLATLMEAVGIMLFVPIMTNIGEASGGFNTERNVGIVESYTYKLIEAVGLPESIVGVIIVTIAVFIIKGFLVLLALGYSVYLKTQLLEKLKKTMFSFYKKMDYSYYINKDTGHFINVINEQINRSIQSFSFLVQLGSQMVSGFLYILLSFLISWKFGLSSVIIAVFLMFIFRGLSARIRIHSRINAKENGKLASYLIEFLQSFKYLTATAKSGDLQDKVEQSIQKLCYHEVRIGISNAFIQSMREPVGVILIMGIVYFQVAYLDESISLILVSILLFYRGIGSIFSVQANWQRTLEYIGSMELVDKEIELIKDNLEKSGTKDVSTLSKSISLKGLTFSYVKNKQEGLINNINIEIKAKEMVAFAGPSGSGKTTIIDLILMILKPQKGEVLIDGISSKEINLSSWRKQVGYVTQDGVIFNGTILNNIAGINCNVSDKETLKKVKSAAKQANILGFIEGLPQGFKTNVGERGVKLSGGQRQRLFIARELYREPSLLVFDEATSALDSSSEREIIESINILKGKITIIVIAHRLSTIKNTDRIFIMESGRVVEVGTYSSLVNNNNSKFFSMVNLQKI